MKMLMKTVLDSSSSASSCCPNSREGRPVLHAVSLIIVNYNAGDCLEACVSSALHQVDEVIVVDNASADSSLAQLEEAFPADSKLRIIRNQRNLGFAAACNIGVGKSSGSYLLFLNPDCVLVPDSVKQLSLVLQNYPDAGMVGGLLMNSDGTEQAGGRRAIPTPWRSFVRGFGLSCLANRWPKLFFDFCLNKEPLPLQPIEVEAISGACMMVRREAMQDVGGLDEGYFLHCEDLDWCMRFRQKGWKILFVPSARLTHAIGTCSRKCPIFVEWHKHKGMMRFYRKFFRHQYPGVLMGLVAGGVWLRFGLVATYYLGRRAGWALRLGHG
jgi:GT2 family glycosyltransferase